VSIGLEGKMEENRAVLTVEEVAAVLGISRGLAYAAVREGHLPHIRIGRRILVPVAALERFLEQAGQAEVTPSATRQAPLA
jgi:excisionase family DNA binding protein